MPIYEYRCKSCGEEFELLIRGTSAPPACPACTGADLERLLSLPAVQSETTHALAMKAAKARDKRQGSERVQAQREYEAHHDD
jgi:putative FmdB family regulatory protein